MSGFFLFSLLSAIVQILFPLFLSIHLYADIKERKLYFSLYILRIFKVYGGYATLYDGGIAFHLTKNRAALLPYSEIVNASNNLDFKISRGFYIYAFSSIAEIGAKSEPAAAVLAAALIQIVSGFAAGYVFSRKKCASFKSDVILYEGSDNIKIGVRIILVFNFLVVIMAALKILLQTITEKIHEYKRNREKQKS
ncbi:MAG TPA: hypothetical protein H9729_02925 [Candidatus Borkfalkia excrementigallinarum]|uniref:Uncharacterized protein n=1 Tax=Candidatus Borkfalkia excrementigallinarum TaxID=2838506 RepID=A0A9D1ZVP2_9FIRM|nr:hypothetical protein [Candidatus Borkfalkia excrementigallinarum]